MKTKFKKTKYFKSHGSFRVLRCEGRDEHGDYMLSGLFDSDSFPVRDYKIKENYHEVKDFDPSKLERQTCGRKHSSNIVDADYWEPRGDGHLYCSYCGSSKFELFLKVIDEINNGTEGFSMEKASGKNYKYYLTTPHQSQIKFYTPHIPNSVFDNKEELDDLNKKLSAACKKSWAQFQEKFNKK